MGWMLSVDAEQSLLSASMCLQRVVLRSSAGHNKACQKC
jgi:hypothetical protein